MKQILAFGDSITKGSGEWPEIGWVGRLKQFLKNYEVINKGIPGDTADDILKRFEFKKDDILIIAIGTNDSKRGIQEEKDFKNNIRKVFNKAKENKVFIIGLTPVDEDLIPNTNKRMLKFNNILKQTAKEYNFKFINLFEQFLINHKKLLADGLHPNSEGYNLMFEIIKQELKKTL